MPKSKGNEIFDEAVQKVIRAHKPSSISDTENKLAEKISKEEARLGLSTEEGIKKYRDRSLSEEERHKYYRLNLYSDTQKLLKKKEEINA